MEVQTETYRAAMNGTLERHFSDMIAVIPTRITIEQLKQRLETILAKRLGNHRPSSAIE